MPFLPDWLMGQQQQQQTFGRLAGRLCKVSNRPTRYSAGHRHRNRHLRPTCSAAWDRPRWPCWALAWACCRLIAGAMVGAMRCKASKAVRRWTSNNGRCARSSRTRRRLKAAFNAYFQEPGERRGSAAAILHKSELAGIADGGEPCTWTSRLSRMAPDRRHLCTLEYKLLMKGAIKNLQLLNFEYGNKPSVCSATGIDRTRLIMG